MITRFSLFFLMLFSFIMVNAQVHRKGVAPVQRGSATTDTKTPDYSVAQLMGKWQEFKRTDYHGNVVGFTDSLQLNFTDTNKVETRTSISNSMSMTGVASIDGDNTLTAAADSYTIKEFGKNEMVLDDNDQYLHQFKKVDVYWYEMLGKESVKQDTYDSSVKTSITTILGKWSIYKRQAKPGAVTKDVQLIKYLDITSKTNDSSASGNVTFYQGQSSQQLPCTVSVSGSNIKIVAGSSKWDLSIFQADADNFIFGNSGLLYFSKKDN
jgi:hypothetical protein